MMNTDFIKRYLKSPPQKLSHLNHLLTYLTHQINQQPEQDASTLYYRPPKSSELGRQCREAFRVLKKLEADEDFQLFLRTPAPVNNAAEEDYLSETFSKIFSTPKAPVPSPAEIFTIAGHDVSLRHVPTYWYIDANVLLDIHTCVGNGLRSDGSVRLDLVLKYYAIRPSHPSTALQWQSVLQTLREYRATQMLGHGGYHANIESSLVGGSDKTIKRVIEQIEKERNQSLFRTVLPEYLSPQQRTTFTTTPTVLLLQILSLPHNLELADRIVEALDWYGAQAAEECPRAIKMKLLLRALWLTVSPDPQAEHDNEFKIPIENGTPYSTIRQNLIQAYATQVSGSASKAEMILCVAKLHIDSELWIEDVPDDLAFGVSSVWVYFKSGFMLAQAIAPGAFRHMSFEQLLHLPAEYLRANPDNSEQLELVSTSRLAPTMHWAKANRLLPLQRSEYTHDEIASAVTALEQHEREMAAAAQDLDLPPPSRWRSASDKEYDTAFYAYLETPRSAYKTLITSLLARIQRSVFDIERHEIRVYALRTALHDTQAIHENKRNTDEVRGRTGFILRASDPSTADSATFIEVFPFAGVIRVRRDIKTLLIGGELNVKNVIVSSHPNALTFREATELPFDWQAYQTVKNPIAGKTAQLIAEQIGDTLPGLATPNLCDGARDCSPLYSSRSKALAGMIARELYFFDEKALLEHTRQKTREVDIGQELLDDLLSVVKFFAPFWGPIEDLVSGDPQRIESGAQGLLIDGVSFGIPVGKYLAGSVRLLKQVGSAGVRTLVPAFRTLSREFVVGLLKELNPLSGSLDLARYAAVSLKRMVLRNIKWSRNLLSTFRSYSHHPISVDPNVWVPQRAGDKLFTIANTANVPMRNVSNFDEPDYRMIDAATNQPFGPRYREPVTVISNSDPLIKRYAAPSEWINGLKADAHGIYFRAGYNQKLICNIDEHGTIAVYQVRENSYGFIEETASTGSNSFSVVLVNPRTNRDLSVNLSSVEPGHWFSKQIRTPGGGPDAHNVVASKHLQEWSTMAEALLHKSVIDFAETHKLDPNALRQFVQTRPQYSPQGQALLEHAQTARTTVNLQHLQDWHNLSQQRRNTLTREGFAAGYNLDPLTLIEHVNMDGSLRDAGKVLEAFTLNKPFTSIADKHLQEWRTIYRTPRSGLTMTAFVERNNLNPLDWRKFVNEDGSFTQDGLDAMTTAELIRSGQQTARKRQNTKSSSSDSAPPEDFTESNTRRAPKRPAASADPLAPSQGHRISNNAPILQDPHDVTRSLTLELEGPIDKIQISFLNDLFADVSLDIAQTYEPRILNAVHDWIRHEGQHHDRFQNTLELTALPGIPRRGLSVIAKRRIERFEVLGPYTGKIHMNEESLREEILTKSELAVATFCFEPESGQARISAHGNSNILSMINAPKAPRFRKAGSPNVESVNVGKYMVFIVAKEEIAAGQELLMNYGDKYWKNLRKAFYEL